MESLFLTYLAARFYIFRCGDYAEAFVCIYSTENHTLTLNAHHLSRSEVGHEENTLTDEFLRILVESSDT